MRDLIFFSYSHKDKEWLKEFQITLAPILRNQQFLTWADTDIKPGAKWNDEISKALGTARVAVLLVSRYFLASDFIHSNELPQLLQAAAKDGLTILWVYLSPCMYKYTPIGEFQAAHDIAKPLESLTGPRRRHVLVEICEKIVAAYEDQNLGGNLLRQLDPTQIPKGVI